MDPAPDNRSIQELLARREESNAYEKQLLRIDAERAREEYTEALEMLRELTGLPKETLNCRIAQRLAEKKGRTPCASCSSS